MSGNGDVLIHGMEMPTNCYKCPMRRRNGMDIVCPIAHERFSIADVNILEYRLKNCPLVPIPKHGRLGDLDKLVKEVKDMAKEFPPDSIGAERYRLFVEFIKTAPTIIPAEEGE